MDASSGIGIFERSEKIPERDLPSLIKHNRRKCFARMPVAKIGITEQSDVIPIFEQRQLRKNPFA